MPCRAPSLLFTLSTAFVAALACGPGDERKDGAEGIADAFYDLAEHECHCIAEESGQGSRVEEACRDQIDDIEEFFPASCIEAVIERNPEARPAYDCVAEVTYDYVECLVGEGCDRSEDCAGDKDDPDDCADTCDSILEAGVTKCPHPPENIGPEIEACFPELTCEDGSELPEDFACDGEPDCPGGEDEAGCARTSERPLDLRRRASVKASKRLGGGALRAR